MLRDEYFSRVYHDEFLAWYAQRVVRLSHDSRRVMTQSHDSRRVMTQSHDLSA